MQILASKLSNRLIVNAATRRAWRKERMAYTTKLLIFASPNGAEVIDVVPFVEITAVKHY
jgi:hypothetical protein